MISNHSHVCNTSNQLTQLINGTKIAKIKEMNGIYNNLLLRGTIRIERSLRSKNKKNSRIGE